MYTKSDEKFMLEAFALAEQAATQGEVPVGAVVVKNNQIIGKGYNQPITCNDPSAHAEIIALRDAAKHSNNYRLPETTLYVTLEPCLMCVGALVHARVKRVIFGASDAKAGAIISQTQMLNAPFLNHTVHYQSGLLAEQCGHILSDFFKSRRNETKNPNSAA